MLPAESRLRDSDSYRRVVRRGRRAASPLLVAHVLTPDGGQSVEAVSQAGLVVSRAVGNAVVRNRVKRRLRHLLTAPLAELPAGTRVVVRAQPAAAGASSAELGDALTRCLSRATRRSAAA